MVCLVWLKLLKIMRLLVFSALFAVVVWSSCAAQIPVEVNSKADALCYGLHFDLPLIENPDSLLLSQLSVPDYHQLVGYETPVLITDSLTGVTIRLFSLEEIRKKSVGNGLELVSPERVFPEVKLSDE
jgi:hypothetical protein